MALSYEQGTPVRVCDSEDIVRGAAGVGFRGKGLGVRVGRFFFGGGETQGL